jgi:hypothetical protein
LKGGKSLKFVIKGQDYLINQNPIRTKIPKNYRKISLMNINAKLLQQNTTKLNSTAHQKYTLLQKRWG